MNTTDAARWMRTVVMTGMVAGVAVGCSTASSTDEAAPPPDVKSVPVDACGAQTVGSMTGEMLDENNRQWIEDRARASEIRVIEPDQVYTMDYRSERLNISLDDQRQITKLACG